MKNLVTILMTFCLAFPGIGQIEMGKTKNSIMGKGKILGGIGNELILDNFNINLILYAYGEDQGGGNAVVGVRTHLTNIDEALAQNMVNEAYAYFVDKWKERGVTVVVLSKEEIEASKKYSKGMKKGNANITNGGVWDNATKKNHNMMAWPEGVNIASSGSGPMAVQGTFQHVFLERMADNPAWTSFNSTVNFMTFKTAKLGSTASVTPKPQLTVGNTMGAGQWVKNKVGGYGGSNGAEGIEDFYSKLDQDGFDFLGSSSNDWNYIADKDKYKANVMEMIKKGMDDLFTDFDQVKADNTK